MFSWQVLAHNGDGGFGQDDMFSGFADLFVIFLYGRDDLVFTPFEGLVDVALKQGDERCGCRRAVKSVCRACSLRQAGRQSG